MTLLDNIKNEQNFTLTENGALALNSTSNALVDLFALRQSLRSIPGMSGAAWVKGVPAG